MHLNNQWKTATSENKTVKFNLSDLSETHTQSWTGYYYGDHYKTVYLQSNNLPTFQDQNTTLFQTHQKWNNRNEQL